MPNSNAILASLSEGDASALRPYLKHVHLELKKILFNIGDIIDFSLFPHRGSGFTGRGSFYRRDDRRRNGR